MKKSEADKLFMAMYGSEKKFRQALKADWLAVQFDWSCFIDSLCKNGDITQQQYESWLFPW